MKQVKKPVVGPGKGFKSWSLENRCDPKIVFDRYMSGETTDSIGKEFGVNGKSVIHLLNKHFPDRKKFSPRTIRSISSVDSSTPLVSERSSV